MSSTDHLQQLFIDSLHEAKTQSEQAWHAQDWQTMHAILHKLLGGLYYVDNDLIEPTQQLKQALSSHQPTALEAVYQHWCACIHQTLEEEST